MGERPAGYVIYDAPSMLDGQRIVVIVTGIKGSRNTKTGKMVQTYILRPDMHPLEAVRTGADYSICGNCPARGDGTGKGRICYVTLIHGPRNVWQSYMRGVYPKATASEVAEIVAGKMVRLGTYGDPAAAPLALWETLIAKAEGWTGYTHQWRTAEAGWSRLVMASADSVADSKAAWLRGYRTFRVGAVPMTGREINCPASKEAGERTQCISCKLCMGSTSKAPVSIQIAPHGAGAKHYKEAA
jgi:hypothetical protein